MKSKLKLVLIAGVSITLVLLTSCSSLYEPPLNDNVKKFDVFLKVKNNPDTLTIQEIGKTKCKLKPGQSKADYGCLDIPIGDQAVVTFDLKTGSWHMAEMKICKGDTKASMVCSLNEKEQAEFSVMEIGGVTRYHPDSNGVIAFSQIPQRISEFRLIDLNSFPRDYFYSLKACSNDNTECVYTDPPIKNGGGRN